VHIVHVHLCEEQHRSGNDRWDEHLLSLPALTNVACLHIPCDVLAHKRPPIVLDDKSSGCVKAAVSHIVMSHMYSFDVTVPIEYSLMCSLGISLP
jgi:hypothetical protein